MQSLKGRELVLASHNPGKLLEFQTALASEAVLMHSAVELQIDEPKETGTTFEANALIKARYVARHAGKPALADDSGLAVHGLDGAPGVYSARWAGPGKHFIVAMNRIQLELEEKGSSDFSASFVCALAVVWPDGETVTSEGRIDGHVVFPPRGENGFGYDPIFVPEGEKRTFGEMAPAEKAKYSHRMRALAGLVLKLF